MSCLHQSKDQPRLLKELIQLEEKLEIKHSPLSVKLSALRTKMQQLPAWTGVLFKQAWDYVEQNNHRLDGEPQHLLTMHLVSQLYIVHEALIFVLAAQQDVAFQKIRYPEKSFPLLGALSKHLSLEIEPRWVPFQMPAHRRTLCSEQHLHAEHENLRGLVTSSLMREPRLFPWVCKKRQVQDCFALCEIDKTMEMLFHPMLYKRGPLSDTPLTDTDLLAPYHPNQTDLSLFVNLCARHDQEALRSGTWQGYEPVVTICSGRAVFIRCLVDKTHDKISEDSIVSCACTPIEQSLYDFSNFPTVFCEEPTQFTHAGGAIEKEQLPASDIFAPMTDQADMDDSHPAATSEEVGQNDEVSKKRHHRTRQRYNKWRNSMPATPSPPDTPR